jgi:hypothetical protein
MQPQWQKKVARAYRTEGSVVLYRSVARSLFKAERSLLRAEPWWSIVLGAPLFLRTLLRLVFLCPHRHKGPPIRLRESIPSSLSGYRTVHGRVTYITCLDCGHKFAYNHKTGRLLDFWASITQKHWQEFVGELMDSFLLFEVSLQESAG